MKTKQLLPLAVVALLSISVASFAQEKKWDKTHPRRDQVNDRLQNQNTRIHDKVEDGKMSKAEAAKLHKEDRAIRKEERAMAAKHDGHITREQQEKINHQENKVSRQIKNH
ncbi:MAG: hypothetical protein GTN67_05710 [Hydrotalea flava]|uniref:hypothetical protein n=1 Tax=Hydrotalea sp. AMD TaxID=2501297 RepID=UPI0010278E59|nr:hypothetical protein [Hydrotalea sp. AMD]NIM34932.1 hypothetical protein [Hydrotalea flava]NIM37758.1 hypothetical protein [Hydrotalea flava]NIN02927.1 hypothetical protein [Hydrotalea flava]NIN14612.1 hypothetical protein [Hydrotalea flava]NIO93684.1 hypothetical protein [Hydrotalea flava]